MPETNGSFDDLLDTPPTPEEKSAVADLKDGGEPAPSAAEARIAALEAKLEAALALAANATAAAATTSESKTEAEKQLEHATAVRSTATALNAPEALEAAEVTDPNVIVIHILDTGFTFADRVWQFGQTVAIKRDGKAFQDTVDRNGNSWLNDLSLNAQLERFRKVVVGEGPYRGPAFNDELARQDAKRGVAAPLINI